MAYAYDHQEEYARAQQPGAAPAGDAGARVAQMRATARELLQALFTSSGFPTLGGGPGERPPPAAIPTPRAQQQQQQQQQQQANPEYPSLGGGGGPAAVAQSGNLTMVDDDLAARSDAHPTAPGATAWDGRSRAADGSRVENFPALPQAAAPRAPVVMPKPPPRQLTAAEVAAAAARREAEAAAAVREAAAADRRRALGDAFGKGEGDASTFAAEALRGFSAEVLTVARAQPALVAHLETTLDAFLSGGKRREAMPPMPRAQRTLVHELAKHYGIATQSYDTEPRRHVDLFRTDNSTWPGFRLSDAIKARPASLPPPPRPSPHSPRLTPPLHATSPGARGGERDCGGGGGGGGAANLGYPP